MKRPQGRWMLRAVLGGVCAIVVYLGVLVVLRHFGYPQVIESDLYSYLLLGVMIILFLPVMLPRRPKD